MSFYKRFKTVLLHTITGGIFASLQTFENAALDFVTEVLASADNQALDITRVEKISCEVLFQRALSVVTSSVTIS